MTKYIVMVRPLFFPWRKYQYVPKGFSLTSNLNEAYLFSGNALCNIQDTFVFSKMKCEEID